jgi:hypothetical protein
VEYYSSKSPELTEFFFYKLQELLSNNKAKKYLEKTEGSKLNRRRFTVAFLNNINKIQVKTKNFHELINTAEENFGNAFDVYQDDIRKQDEQFHNKLRQKMLRKTRFKRKKTIVAPDDIAQEFIKKFIFNYFQSIVSKAMQVCLNTYDDLFNEKILVSKDFDPQIKEFEILESLEEGKL